MDVIFLFYGLAFLALGFVIVVRYDAGSALKLSRPLWLLAAFGFVHGLLEWTELWRVVRGDTPALAAARPFILLASFVLLLEFGRRLTLMSLAGSAPAGRAGWLRGPGIHALVLLGVAAGALASDDRLAALALWSRQLPGVLGAVLAGLGCYLYRRRRFAETEAGHSGSLAWYVAAAAFFAYAFFGGVVGAGSALIDEDAFLASFSLPVQAPRALCAILIAAAIGRIMRVFGEERQVKLQHAVLAAQYSLVQLHESRARYEGILEASAEGIIGLDAEGNFSFANEAALAMLGFTRGDLLGRSFHSVAHHMLADGSVHSIDDCLIHKTMADGRTRHADADVFWRKNRTWFPAAYRVARVHRGDQVFGVVVVLRDLAEPR